MFCVVSSARSQKLKTNQNDVGDQSEEVLLYVKVNQLAQIYKSGKQDF